MRLRYRHRCRRERLASARQRHGPQRHRHRLLANRQLRPLRRHRRPRRRHALGRKRHGPRRRRHGPRRQGHPPTLARRIRGPSQRPMLRLHRIRVATARPGLGWIGSARRCLRRLSSSRHPMAATRRSRRTGRQPRHRSRRTSSRRRLRRKYLGALEHGQRPRRRTEPPRRKRRPNPMSCCPNTMQPLHGPGRLEPERHAPEPRAAPMAS